MARGVKGIQTPGVAHRRAERQGLAARPCTEIDHHLAALGIGQQREQLAALVLNLDIATHEHVELVQGRLAFGAQAPWRKWGRFDLDTGCREFGQDLLALGLEGVHAQIERRVFIQRVDKRPEVVDHLGLQALSQPFGQVVAQAFGQGCAVDGFDLLEPLRLAFDQRRAQKGRIALPAQQHQTTLHLAAA